ncbi:MAG: Rab family GTPase [Promethearchaeota archaeon]
MGSEIIKGIVYTEFDEIIGPNPVSWVSYELSEDTINLLGLKAITFLAAEQDITPKSLILLPYPSLNLKAIIKFIEIKEKDQYGGVGQYAITLVFKEEDDAIFYKHLKDIERIFNDTANNILELELSERNEIKLKMEIEKLQIQILDVLNDLRIQEQSAMKSEAFPKIEDLSGYQFKIIICGDPLVGKTSIALRFTESAFSRTYLPTIGVNISEKTIFIDNYHINFIFWDIAGHSKFNRLRKHFYEGADGVLLVFDLTNLDSINNINQWYKDIKKYATWKCGIKGFIFGNKKDLISKREVFREKGLELANKLKLEYIETSALTGENINESFYKLGKALLSLQEEII